jgi:acyl dehydratase
MQTRQARGLYFDDFEIGKTYTTPRRTVTQTDIVNFANLSGDFNAPHVDWEFCKQQPYGEPIAHGPLVLAIAGGLTCQSGINDGTIVAMMGIAE